MLDFNGVKTALRGVSGAYFCYPIAPGLIQATAQFAQEAGVEAIVNMSQKIAREDALSHAAFEHWLAERVFDWSGVPVTHLRPTFFAEWFFYLSPMIRQGTIYALYGTGRHAPIAAEDLGRVYPLYGPVEYTFPEMVAIISDTLGRGVTYQQAPFEAMRDAFTAPTENIARDDALTGYAEANRPGGSGPSHLMQPLGAAVIDHNNGLFGGEKTSLGVSPGYRP